MQQTHTKLNKATHLQRILESINQLLLVSAKTGNPAPIPHQYIGTVIDNTIGLLTATANSLDLGNRVISHTEDHQWLSLMQSVNRSFFSSIHIATETALAHICTTNNIEVLSRQQEKMSKAIDAIEAAIENKAILKKQFKSLRASCLKHPAFKDYLETALSIKEHNSDFKKTWRKFFDALSIIRNKVSHSNPTLNYKEKEKIRDGGFGVFISAEGTLQFNSRMYEQVAVFTLEFFDELTSK